MNQLPWHNQSIIPHQRPARGANSLLAVLGQWELGRAGVFAGQRPLGLAVADDEAARGDGHDEVLFGGSSSISQTALLVFSADSVVGDCSAVLFT